MSVMCDGTGALLGAAGAWVGTGAGFGAGARFLASA